MKIAPFCYITLESKNKLYFLWQSQAKVLSQSPSPPQFPEGNFLLIQQQNLCHQIRQVILFQNSSRSVFLRVASWADLRYNTGNHERTNAHFTCQILNIYFPKAHFRSKSVFLYHFVIRYFPVCGRVFETGTLTPNFIVRSIITL